MLCDKDPGLKDTALAWISRYSNIYSCWYERNNEGQNIFLDFQFDSEPIGLCGN
jgi:hypothetical protein